MKKENTILTIIILSIFLLSDVFSAPQLQISKIDKGSAVIKELGNPAIFDFVIVNNDSSDSFEIYSLIGVSMSPKGYFTIPSGESKIEVIAYPSSDLLKQITGFFSFGYQLKGQQQGIFKDNLLIKIVSLAEALEITAEPINPADQNVVLTVKNLENANIESIKIDFESPFFDKTSQELSFGPSEQREIEIPLEKEKIKKMLAGPYIVKSTLHAKEKNIKIESIVNYLEKTGLSVEQKTEGWLVRKTTIKKTNEGNMPATAKIEIKKNIVSRLFTLNNPEAAVIQRNGFFVTYEWEKSLSPDESLFVETTTNYTIPFVIIILLVIAGLLAKIYSQTAIILNKKVSLVKTTGGQFALKVKIYVKSKKYVTNVQIIDSLPAMTKLHEKFDKTPSKIEKNRIFWNIDRLSAGEERVYSYIVYSDLRVVGRFELPAATAVFDRDGKTEEVWSNRAFFAAETSERKEE